MFKYLFLLPMISLKIFVFNSFQVNTYILYDDTKECIIIDPACSSQAEFNIIENFIKENNLKPVAFYNTHCHIDHVVGNYFIDKYYKIPLGIHKAGLGTLKLSKVYGLAMGLHIEKIIKPSFFLNEGDEVKFGNSVLKVLYTPGHLDGSICFYSEKDKFVIVGDVLFHQGIGRTDLPTGNYDLLISSIKTKLFILPDSTVVYPGHGESTSIGYEKKFNPFLK